MIRFRRPHSLANSHNRSRGEATINIILAIILISGVFLAGGVLPHMEDDTLKKDTTSVVQGVKSEDSSGTSLIAAAGSSNDSKRTLQMKQLLLVSATPTPSSPTTPTPTPTSNRTSSVWDITVGPTSCQDSVGKIEVTMNGSAVGYLMLEIFSRYGAYLLVDTIEFNPTEKKVILQLSNSSGFNGSEWKLTLFEGGTLSGGIWKGGTTRKSLEQSPTSC